METLQELFEKCPEAEKLFSDFGIETAGGAYTIDQALTAASDRQLRDIGATKETMAELVKALLQDEKPAYIRVGRNAVDPVYEEGNVPFEMDKATVVCEGTDVAIIACGEMVKPAKDAAEILKGQGISATVVDMYCVKPLDSAAVVKAAENAKAVITVEEHAPFGGLGSMVSQVVGRECPRKVINMSLPDAPVITGTSKEVFDHYGLNAEGIAKKAAELVK